MILDGNGMTKDGVSLDQIDPDMPRAAIGAEDSRFCSHHGFDADAIENAFIRNMRGGKIRGGSTISQQTAKNAFLWQNGGFFRKGLEAWFTILIENLWGKKRIMEVYLNVAETGIGTYRSEEHTSELQSLMRISYAVFCLKKKTYKYRTLKNH